MSVKVATVERAPEGGLPPEIREREVPLRYLYVIAHGYQPIREYYLPDDTILPIIPNVNERIYQECYKPNLVDREIPQGFVFSLYPTLREWMKQAHPEGFDRIREKIQQMPDKGYNVLGDPLIHVILPLLPAEDQDMLLKMGRRALTEDFDLEPEGLWLPETAKSNQTLEFTCSNRYKFVVTRDHQLWSTQQNPMYVRLMNGGEIAVFHFQSGLSGEVSHNRWTTMNADNFLTDWVPAFVPDEASCVGIGSDMERYGHHLHRDDYKWLQHLLRPETLARHGFAPLSIKAGLTRKDRAYTDVKEYSSWSCEHNLGRWTGECDCGYASWDTQNLKRSLYRQLSEANLMINQQLDDKFDSWREEFMETFLTLRSKIFTGQDFLTGLRERFSTESYTLYAAKIYTLLGFTSCGWFDGKSDSPEREIPKTMVSVVRQLLEGDPSTR